VAFVGAEKFSEFYITLHYTFKSTKGQMLLMLQWKY